MKAFQLKIAIKNSHPPIWRRVIVPAGITFSQLSMILNKAMGWCGYHLFEVEFYHLQQRIIEDAGEYGGHSWNFDYVEASETYIREYLEENEWFTYTYDLGDDWQHRVTVEKVLTDYELNYPRVVKYKGNCPIEDCGCQGGFAEYDMEEVNRALEREFFYQWGKGEKRCQEKIYEEHFSGKYGLNATKQDKNKKLQKEQLSTKHQLEEFMRRFEQNFAYKKQLSDFGRISLAEIFDDYEKEDLREIAEEKGLKGIKKYSKKDLIAKLVEHMTRPEIINPYFLCMWEEEAEELERAMETDGIYYTEKEALLLRLYEAEYIGMLSDGGISVPSEVMEAYASIKGEMHESKRRKCAYVRLCLSAMESLYGIVPMDIFMKLIKQNKALHISEEDVRETIQLLPKEYGEVVLVNDTIYVSHLYPDDGGLLETQRGKEFYIPSYEEIFEFGKYGHGTESREAEAFRTFLEQKMKLAGIEAEALASILQIHITAGSDIRDLFEIMENFEVEPKNPKQADALSKHVFALWNSTRMIANRGFKPSELTRGGDKNAKKTEQAGKVIDFPTERVRKIYPNDPCPCGSGKKYKNCCKNK